MLSTCFNIRGPFDIICGATNICSALGIICGFTNIIRGALNVIRGGFTSLCGSEPVCLSAVNTFSEVITSFSQFSVFQSCVTKWRPK